jgi:hypothetical protein
VIGADPHSPVSKERIGPRVQGDYGAAWVAVEIGIALIGALQALAVFAGGRGRKPHSPPAAASPKRRDSPASALTREYDVNVYVIKGICIHLLRLKCRLEHSLVRIFWHGGRHATQPE